ncbi:peptide ABC transporter substrate-binding protein [Arthrobacter sp. H14]|uniref:peptide ABC transporter substrate-binding protein n=1 Tax=Arthrobacter sp. H14 TaxID=1312959 RepID=UPI00047EE4C1|nr:ABC transporter substrate-binding protein [Arthrobacter sp. H14]
MKSIRQRALLKGVGLAVVAGLALTGCGGDAESQADGDGAVIITANTTEPQNPLVPTSTNEVGGGRVITQLFAGLVSYDVDGTMQNEVAKSIETEDSQTYDITLEKGWTFTNGEKVTAHSFVDAWNYGALATNAQLSANFFAPIEGYEDVNPSKEGAEPTAKTMSGLKVVDDYHFTVTLNQPESDFPLRLGYSAYSPLPQVAFEDMDAFGENPIGNGPYMMDGEGAWEHNRQIRLVKNPDYEGNRTVKNDGLTLRVYTDNEAAYADVQDGALDLIDAVPASALKTYTENESIKSYSQPGSVFQSFTIPERLKHFGGEEGQLRRHALSMSINRPQIAEAIFQGSVTPATDFTAPTLDGYSDSLEGSDVLEYNPEQAKKLWAEANKINEWTGTFKLGYNGDDSHKQWVDAVTNQISNTLEIEAIGAPTATFGQFRSLITEREIQYPFRSGWQGDYPSIGNYLVALYSSDAADGNGSNDGDYKNEEFDKKVAQAAAADSPEKGIELYQEAEEILLEDLPAIPLWYENVAAASVPELKNVEFDWKNVPAYYQITKK